jgi:hypothetical protein
MRERGTPVIYPVRLDGSGPRCDAVPSENLQLGHTALIV